MPKARDQEFEHTYISTWEQGVSAGHVVDERDRDHPVRVVGFTHEITQQGDDDVLDKYGRGHRMINAPVYVSLAHAKAMLERYSNEDAYARLIALDDVFTFANWYRMEVI